MQNIHQKEDLSTVPDDEKGNLELPNPELYGNKLHMSSAMQDHRKSCYGLLYLWEPLRDLKVWLYTIFRYVGNIPHAQTSKDTRLSMNQSSLTSCGQRTRASETIGKVASWLATFTFCLWLFTIMLSRPLFQSHGAHSLLLAIIALFNFTVFVSAASVMMVVGARFTWMQITMLLISPVALLFA